MNTEIITAEIVDCYECSGEIRMVAIGATTVEVYAENIDDLAKEFVDATISIYRKNVQCSEDLSLHIDSSVDSLRKIRAIKYDGYYYPLVVKVPDKGNFAINRSMTRKHYNHIEQSYMILLDKALQFT